MTTFDLTPLLRSSVGFDRMTRMLDSAMRGEETGGGYPPYNIEKLDEDRYVISMAVAGFGEEDIDITVQESQLTVTGQAAREENGEERTFLHRGIAQRAFQRQFQLADHIKVVGASLEHGMLTIRLEREIPEAAKPRKIEILSAHKQIEQKPAKTKKEAA